ncbi:MAG: hypothetical protein C4292_03540 [Nitrososphaera sp.]
MRANNSDDKEEGEEVSSSIISTTRYGHNSAKILRSIEKNFVIVIVIIAVTFAFSLLDTAGLLKYLNLYSETEHDVIATAFSIVSLAAMAPLLAYIVKSRRLLERWQSLFERNSLKASLEISLTGVSRGEIVRALAESVEEISEPLQEYLNAVGGSGSDSDRDLAAFQGGRHGTDFEILIDPDSVVEPAATTTSAAAITPAAGRLKSILREFGSVCVKVSGTETVNAAAAESFIQSLSRYASSTGNPVELGLLIGQDIEPGAYHVFEKSVHVGGKGIRNILIIEKPAASSSSLLR